MTTTADNRVIPVGAGNEKSLIRAMADKYHVEPEKFLSTLKSTAFKQKPGEEVTTEQMMMLLVVANEYNLNPFLKQIYAFPDKNKGIVPIVGVDGYIRIVNEHPEADGWSFNVSKSMVDIDAYAANVPEWIECVMHRKDRSHSTVARCYMIESYREPFKYNDGNARKGPWQTYTRLMLENRAFIRSARFAFGFTGIYSEDDADRMQTNEYIDAEVVEEAPERQSDEVTAADVDNAPVNKATGEISEIAYILNKIEDAATDDDLDLCEDFINSLKGKDKSTAKAALMNRRSETAC